MKSGSVNTILLVWPQDALEVVGAVHGEYWRDGHSSTELRTFPRLPITGQSLLLLWQHGEGKNICLRPTDLPEYIVVGSLTFHPSETIIKYFAFSKEKSYLLTLCSPMPFSRCTKMVLFNLSALKVYCFIQLVDVLSA